jgi:hypothetical protein
MFQAGQVTSNLSSTATRAKELTTDLDNYDKEQAEKARRELEEADAGE